MKFIKATIRDWHGAPSYSANGARHNFFWNIGFILFVGLWDLRASHLVFLPVMIAQKKEKDIDL